MRDRVGKRAAFFFVSPPLQRVRVERDLIFCKEACKLDLAHWTFNRGLQKLRTFRPSGC